MPFWLADNFSEFVESRQKKEPKQNQFYPPDWNPRGFICHEESKFHLVPTARGCHLLAEATKPVFTKKEKKKSREKLKFYDEL